MSSRPLYLQPLPDRPFSPADVRHYYDANTRAFVRHGHGSDVGAIHRAVWGPGVRDRSRAFHYVEDLIIERLDALALDRPAMVADLGCGIGASLTYVAQQRPVRGTGVTISPLQASLGQERVVALGLADRVQILEGDYCALPPRIGDVDLAYAIESFVHGPSPDRFFSEAARVLRPGGLLVLCDDVRTDSGQPQAARTLETFARGWHVNALLTPAEWETRARQAGLAHVQTLDLTRFLELGRPRDRLIAWLTFPFSVLSRVPTRLAPLVGGTALQRGLTRGWIAYHCAVFERR